MTDRSEFNTRFLRDLNLAWEKFGPAALEQAVRENPGAFVKTASGVLPREAAVQISTPASINGMTTAELNTLMGLIQAIQSRITHAGDMKPEAVFEYVGRALDAYTEPKLIPSANNQRSHENA